MKTSSTYSGQLAVTAAHAAYFTRIALICFVVLVWTAQAGYGQGVAINDSGNSPDASAILDVSSDDKGVLLPRVSLSSTVDVTTIAAPVVSLLVYNTNASISGGAGEGFYYWDGAQWTPLAGSGGSPPCSQAPSTPGAITGPALVCPGAIGQVYTISPVSGATSYNWSVPLGATITSNTGTSITVSYPPYSGGTISVTAANSCGTSGPGTLVISQNITCPPLTYYYTGAPQSFTVPAGVYYLVCKVWGASGGQNSNSGNFGKGGYAEGTIPVTPGSVVQINVGGQGSSSTAGWNGGGTAQNGAGGGGGASDIRLSTDLSLSGRLIVAGGGGGTGNAGGTGGGNGGGLNGYSSGNTLNPGTDATGGQGGGGTQSAGGTAGVSWVSSWPTLATNGNAGSFGQGGNGVTNVPGGYFTGGGGGGWYGGGSGATSGAYAGQCGGGGSGHLDGIVTSGSMTSGIWTGNGQVILSW